MGNDSITWLVGALVVLVLAIQVVIPTAITSAASVQTTGTATGELWSGTAATAHSMTYSPITEVTAFKKAASYSQYNDTKLSGPGNRSITIDGYAAHSSATWDNLTVVFTLAGVNATNNITWTVGTCNAANKTWITSPQTYADIDSTCLTPGGALVFNFVNQTAQLGANVTNITVTYQRYVDNTAYTLSGANGQITPTLTGKYYTTYLYGTTTNNTVNVVLLLLPLLIAVVVLLLLLKSSGMF